MLGSGADGKPANERVDMSEPEPEPEPDPEPDPDPDPDTLDPLDPDTLAAYMPVKYHDAALNALICSFACARNRRARSASAASRTLRSLISRIARR